MYVIIIFLMMNDTQIQFLELLRSALWGTTPDAGLFGNADWSGIYRMACEQTVAALLVDAIARLPHGMMPPLGVKMRFIADATMTERRNRAVGEDMKRVWRLLEDNGIKVAFFKGQIAAARYPHPEHRTPGDVDFIADCPAGAEMLMMAEGGKEGGVVPKHAEIMMDDVLFESHRMALDMAFPPSMSYFNRLIARMFAENRGSESVEGCALPCLPPLLELCHCTAHINHHFLEVGIGLRQLADFALLLARKHDCVNPEELKIHLRGIHMLRFFRALEALSVDYLGLPKEALVMPFSDSDRTNARLIMFSAVKGGNFGRYDGKDKSNGYRRLLLSIGNALRFFRLSPLEALFRPTMTLRVWVQVHLATFSEQKGA